MASPAQAASSQIAPIRSDDLINMALCKKIVLANEEWDILPRDSIFATLKERRAFESSEPFRRRVTVIEGARYLYNFRTALGLSFPLSPETSLSELVRLDLDVQRKTLLHVFWNVVTHACSGQENSPTHQALKDIEKVIYGYTLDGLLTKLHDEIACNPSLNLTYADLRDAFYIASRGEHHLAMRVLLSLAKTRKIAIPLDDLLDWVSHSAGRFFRTAKEILTTRRDQEQFHLLAFRALTGAKCNPYTINRVLWLMKARQLKFTEEEIQNAISTNMQTQAPSDRKELCIGMLKAYSKSLAGSAAAFVRA